MPGKVLRGRRGAGSRRLRAVLAERSLHILSVSPGVTTHGATPAGAAIGWSVPAATLPPADLSTGARWNGRIWPQIVPHRSSVYSFAMQVQIRHPPPRSGAKAGSGGPHQTLGSLQSWLPLTPLLGFGVAPRCQAAAEPFRGTWRRGETIQQLGVP